MARKKKTVLDAETQKKIFNEQKRLSVAKYRQETVDSFLITVPKGCLALIDEAAAKAAENAAAEKGKNLRQEYVRGAIVERMKRDNFEFDEEQFDMMKNAAKKLLERIGDELDKMEQLGDCLEASRRRAVIAQFAGRAKKAVGRSDAATVDALIQKTENMENMDEKDREIILGHLRELKKQIG